MWFYFSLVFNSISLNYYCRLRFVIVDYSHISPIKKLCHICYSVSSFTCSRISLVSVVFCCQVTVWLFSCFLLYFGSRRLLWAVLSFTNTLSCYLDSFPRVHPPRLTPLFDKTCSSISTLADIYIPVLKYTEINVSVLNEQSWLSYLNWLDHFTDDSLVSLTVLHFELAT